MKLCINIPKVWQRKVYWNSGTNYLTFLARLQHTDEENNMTLVELMYRNIISLWANEKQITMKKLE